MLKKGSEFLLLAYCLNLALPLELVSRKDAKHLKNILGKHDSMPNNLPSVTVIFSSLHREFMFIRGYYD